MFLFIVLSVFLLLNYYILRRIAYLWRYKPRAGFYILVICLSFSYIATSALEHSVPSRFIGFLHTLSGLWLGIGFIALIIIAIHDLANLVFRFDRSIARWVVLSLIIVISGYAIINALILEVKTINIDSGIRIVQLSDIHIGSVSNRHVRRIVKKTNAAKPDVVLITGDLIDAHTRLDDDVIAILNEIDSSVFFISGNHERYAGFKDVKEKLKSTKIRILENESVDFGGVQIIGISDDDNEEVLKQRIKGIEVDQGKFSILMIHRPVHLETASEKGIDLMLAGHTHNGQIVPFNFIVKTQFKYIKGLYHNDNCKLYVTTGTGIWGPKMRLGSTNEIVVFSPDSKGTANKQ